MPEQINYLSLNTSRSLWSTKIGEAVMADKLITIKELKEYIRKIPRYTRYGTNRELEEVLEKTITETSYDFSIFTQTNEYLINAVEKENGGYLGCVSRCRKSRAGEDWRRGSDLADGKLSVETWYKILEDIIGHELVKVHKRKVFYVDVPNNITKEQVLEIIKKNST